MEEDCKESDLIKEPSSRARKSKAYWREILLKHVEAIEYAITKEGLSKQEIYERVSEKIGIPVPRSSFYEFCKENLFRKGSHKTFLSKGVKGNSSFLAPKKKFDMYNSEDL